MEKNKNDEIKDAVESRKKAEKESLAADEKKNEEGITGGFINDCLAANERGDGMLFVAKHRGKYLFDKTSLQWYGWTGNYWSRDKLENVFELVESVAMEYLGEAEKLNEQISKARANDEKEAVIRLKARQKLLHDRARRLRGDGAQKCLNWAHRIEEGLKTVHEDFDTNPWLLACNNGVIELRSGRFRPGRPADMLSMAAPHEWKGIDCPAPVWEQFLGDIFAGEKDLIAYVQRLFGYGLTGLTTEHILPVLHGEGRNGKGTLVETLRHVMGELVQPIQSEMLLDQRSARASSGPSPDIMSLKGLRIAFASETDEGRKFSTSRAKWLSGGDTLTGRNPHDKYETVFAPTHLLCLLTNHLPHASGDDYAFWQRIHLVPFKMRFVDSPVTENERPKIKDIRDRLKEEAPGILAWLVRGCIEWQRHGLKPPIVVTAATEQYRLSEDLLAEFLGTCCDDLEESLDARTPFKELYETFEAWFLKTCGDYPPKKRKFTQLMEKRFKRIKAGGQILFYGIRLKDVSEQEQ